MSVAVIFPGQGSQFVGMGKDFYDKFPESRDFFERADKALGYGLSDIMFNGPDEELRLTQNTQPALVTMSAAIWELVKDKIKPSFFAGHSLGEYSAVYAARGMSFEGTVCAVHNRGKFMQTAVPVGEGAMSAVLGLDDKIVSEICASVSKENFIVEPANFNCPGQVVIAGAKDAVEKACGEMKEKGAKRTISLPVSAPFHCSMMAPAANAMKEYLKNVEIKDLDTPVINNIDAKEEKDAAVVKDAFIRQVAGVVRWSESVRFMINSGVTEFVEIGAGSVLTGLVKKIDRNVKTANISAVSDLDKFN